MTNALTLPALLLGGVIGCPLSLAGPLPAQPQGGGGAANAPAPRVPAPAPHGALPSAAHMRWHAEEFYAFVHFNMNTFTGVEWGRGTELPEAFNPTEFDANQWCALFKECGLAGVIITAKHHDGFCLWPSAYTEHDVANSPWKDGNGDVIRELADACAAHKLFLGIYISPWDRNNPIYGQDDEAYNKYFIGQMEELLSNYGEIAEIWWDGANGDRDNPDKHQNYDWPAFNKTVMRLQPNAVTFGPPYANMPVGVRWVGNERGYANSTQWSTYPMGVPERAEELNVGVEGADRWFPAESDVSIRPGWYWTAESDGKVKSAAELLDIYYASVGHNTNLLLNFPVDQRGLVHENDAAALREMTDTLRATFAVDLAAGRPATADHTRGDDPFFGAPRITDGDRETYWAAEDDQRTGTLTVELAGPGAVNQVMLQEYVELGQRVRAWDLEARVDGEWRRVAEGTTIGYKRIARFGPVKADALRLNVRDSRACPTIATFSAYVSPAAAAITPKTLRTSVSFFREPDAGLAVDRFEGDWQTLDQMPERKPVSRGISAGFDVQECSRAEQAALAFTGHVLVPKDGAYEFFTWSDDGSRLFIGDQRVVENDGLHGMREVGGAIGLRAGYHPIRVEYFNATGASDLQVRWSVPGSSKQPIPKSALFQ